MTASINDHSTTNGPSANNSPDTTRPLDRNEALAQFDGASPESMNWLDDGSVAIVWADGEHSVYTRTFLREKCPCATCKGTHGPPTTLIKERPKRGSLNIMGGKKPVPREAAFEIKAVEPVGQYGIRFTWGDGHDTGIYAFRYLRLISPGAAPSNGGTASPNEPAPGGTSEAATADDAA